MRTWQMLLGKLADAWDYEDRHWQVLMQKVVTNGSAIVRRLARSCNAAGLLTFLKMSVAGWHLS